MRLFHRGETKAFHRGRGSPYGHGSTPGSTMVATWMRTPVLRTMRIHQDCVSTSADANLFLRIGRTTRSNI